MDAPQESGSTTGMLDEPSLSRQWVARRLQRALTTELWAGPFRDGLARRLQPPWGPLLADHAAAAVARAVKLRRMIAEVGSSPYVSLGMARPIAVSAGWLLGIANRRAATAAAQRVAANTLAEYSGLHAFVVGAPGVPTTLERDVDALLQDIRAETEALPGTIEAPRV